MQTKPTRKITFTDTGLPRSNEAKDVRHFTTHYNLLARKSCPVTQGWKQIGQDIKDYMWETLKSAWNIDDDTHKETVLRKAGENFRCYRYRLLRDYIRKNPDRDPCKVFNITPGEWEEFKQQKETVEFKAKSEQGKKNIARNRIPHRLGSGGYKKVELDFENVRIQTGEGEPSSICYSLAPRAVQWMVGHSKKDKDEEGRTVYVADKEEVAAVLGHVVAKIAEIDKGQFKENRTDDVLTAALGTQEHPGRLRGHSGFETPKKVYGSGKRQRKSREQLEDEMRAKLRDEIIDELRAKIHVEVRAQLQAQFKRQNLGQLQPQTELPVPVDTSPQASVNGIHVELKSPGSSDSTV